MSAECSAETIPPGYKQTEVGVIPEDWQIVLMGSLGKFSKGQGISKDEAVSGEIPCVRYGEIYTHHNDIIRLFNSRISVEVARRSKRLSKGDLLFAGSGETKEEIGKCVAFVGEEEAYAGGDIVIFTPNKGSSRFFGYLFNSPIIAHQKASKGQGDAIVHISSSALSSIKVPLPPTKAEQESIAEALSDTDALIESLEQLIAKKRQIKQGAMQELLTGKKRLPGFNGKWETKRLGDIAEIRDGTHQTPKYVECGIPFFSVENVTTGDFTNTKFISETEHSFLTKSFKIEKGDILMTRIGSIGDCKFIDWDVDASFYVSLALLKIRKDYSAEFICQYSKTTDFKKEIELNSLQSAIPKKINLGPISDVLIKLPESFDEQTAIAAVLSDMDSEISALEEKLAKARQIKQGMMQELLTGRIRLI